MKIRDLLFTYKSKLEILEKKAKNYYDTHYCGYMGEWVRGSQKEYEELLEAVQDYLEGEVEL